MKKTLLLVVCLLSGTAFARKVVCVDRAFQDATMAATFTLASSMKVDLFIPSGETSGDTVSGRCRRDAGAIELAVTCNVMTSTDSGYEVRLFSIGGPSLHASITPWSMAGRGEMIALPCHN